nr:unnamed protein product [Spirometra erinaceieuropaei]
MGDNPSEPSTSLSHSACSTGPSVGSEETSSWQDGKGKRHNGSIEPQTTPVDLLRPSADKATGNRKNEPLDRQHCVVVQGLSESDASTPKERISADLNMLKHLLNEMLNSNEKITIRAAFRIGKKAFHAAADLSFKYQLVAGDFNPPEVRWSPPSGPRRCCLPLQEYGNISYKLSSLHRRSHDSQERQPTLGAPQYTHRVSSPTESQILSLQPPSPAANAPQRTQVACAIEAIFHLADPEEVKEEDLMSRQVGLSHVCYNSAGTSNSRGRPQANQEKLRPRSDSNQHYNQHCVSTGENSPFHTTGGSITPAQKVVRPATPGRGPVSQSTAKSRDGNARSPSTRPSQDLTPPRSRLEYTFYVKDDDAFRRPFVDRHVEAIVRACQCSLHLNEAGDDTPPTYHRGVRVFPVTISTTNMASLKRCLGRLDLQFPQFNVKAFFPK